MADRERMARIAAKREKVADRAAIIAGPLLVAMLAGKSNPMLRTDLPQIAIAENLKVAVANLSLEMAQLLEEAALPELDDDS